MDRRPNKLHRDSSLDKGVLGPAIRSESEARESLLDFFTNFKIHPHRFGPTTTEAYSCVDLIKEQNSAWR